MELTSLAVAILLWWRRGGIGLAARRTVARRGRRVAWLLRGVVASSRAGRRCVIASLLRRRRVIALRRRGTPVPLGRRRMPVPLGRRVASAVGAGVTRHYMRGMPSDRTSQGRRKCERRSERSWVEGSREGLCFGRVEKEGVAGCGGRNEQSGWGAEPRR